MFGRRRLRKWMLRPLVSPEEIRLRREFVERRQREEEEKKQREEEEKARREAPDRARREQAAAEAGWDIQSRGLPRLGIDLVSVNGKWGTKLENKRALGWGV